MQNEEEPFWGELTLQYIFTPQNVGRPDVQPAFATVISTSLSAAMAVNIVA
jgi:hypothetical protein